MVRFKGEGAGKGDKARPIDKKRFDENYKRIFGDKKTGSGISQWCQHGKNVVKNGELNELCELCNRPRTASPFIDCFGTPRWNQGLGCYTSSIRETEKIAKSKGLAPIGNERIDRVFKQEDKGASIVKAEIADARLRLRAQLRREGKA